MDRRKFLSGVTAAAGATAVGVETASAATAKETRSVTWHVKGFTCITCSVGLEVMLRGLNGVTRATASYPENKVTVGFDEHLMKEQTIREFISVCGFTVA